MRTEVTIPFMFDTTPIEQALEQVAEEEVRRKVDKLIERHVSDAVPRAYNGWGEDKGKPDWSALIRERIDAILERHADKIIDEAALLIAMRASSKRKWRDVLAECKEEMADE
jgi:hypothetical protein